MRAKASEVETSAFTMGPLSSSRDAPSSFRSPLLGGGRATFGWRRLLNAPFRDLPLEPKAVVFARPVHVDSAIAHGFECAFHPNRPDVDMCQHDRDEDDTRYRVHHLCGLHLRYIRFIKRKHQDVAACGHCTAHQHDHPVDGFLAGIEPAGRRMLMPNDATAFPQPTDIRWCREVPSDPQQEDEYDAQRKGETRIIVRVFRPLRPFRECLGPHVGKEQLLAEGDIQASEGEGNKTYRRHPMDEALKAIETHERAT